MASREAAARHDDTMVHMHNMKTRDRNKHVVHELLRTKRAAPGAASGGEHLAKTPSPSDSVRKRKATDAAPSIFGPEVVGRKVAILWRKPGTWYEGKIRAYSEKTKKHLVKYDDGDEAEVNLARERFQFLTNPKPGSAPNSTYHGSPKGKEAVGKKVKVYWPAMGRWYVGRIKEYEKASGKHLIAYQDGEQHLVHLRNEAVRYPHIEEQQKAKQKAKQKARKNKHNQQKQNNNNKGRTMPRGKRVAADCNLDPGAALKKPRSSRSVLDREEVSSPTSVEATSMEMDSTCVSGASDDSESMRNVQCPKTPDHDILARQDVVCQRTDSHEVLQQTTTSSEEVVEAEMTAAAPATAAMAPVAAEPQSKDAVQVKAELAKAKALKAKEIAAQKAAEAAKALAAVAAAQKAEAKGPQGKEAVDWRLGVWSPEEHKYFKGLVTAFDSARGEHTIKFDSGRVASVLLDQQRTKWLNRVAQKHPRGAAAALTPKPLPAPAAASLDGAKKVVGRHIRIVRGQERPVGKIVAFSPSRQKYLLLLNSATHEWSDLRRNNWEFCEAPQKAGSPTGTEAIGRRVGIYWPKRERFFHGVVMNFEPTSGQYLVRYEDKVDPNQNQAWLNLDKEEVKWVGKNPKASKGGVSALKSAKGVQGRKAQPEVVLDAEAADIVASHPEVFAHANSMGGSLGGEKLDVLSNIHNAHGLLTSLEDLSSRHKSHKAGSGLPVHSVDDVWGIKVIEEPASAASSEDREEERRLEAREKRLALGHRLQVLEFMLEHSAHAEHSLRSTGRLDQEPLVKKEDIQPLEPSLSNISLSNFSF